MKNLKLLIFLSLAFSCTMLFATQNVKVKPTPIPAKTPTKVPNVKTEFLFPKDTVEKFIKNYSKDSLIHLIEKRIYKAEDFIRVYSYMLEDDLAPIELTMVADHFGLDIKVPAENMPTKSPFFLLYHLYGKGYGPDTLKQAKTIDSIAAKNADMTDMFMQFIDNKYAQISYVSFCDKVKLQNARIFNTFYDNAKLLHINEKLHIYWLFAEINKNNCDTTLSVKYRHKLFDELYPKNNIANNYLAALKPILKDSTKQIATATEKPLYAQLIEFNKAHNTYMLLAYALYAGDINAHQHADDLMYLLNAQQANGGWAIGKQFDEINKDLQSTIYGLWALCEFRSKIIKEL